MAFLKTPRCEQGRACHAGQAFEASITPVFFKKNHTDFDQVKLVADDQRRYEGWQTVDKNAAQTEMIEFLAWEQLHGPIQAGASRCCAIL